MDFVKIFEVNTNLIISNPAPFAAIFVLTFGGVWAYAKHYYTGRIEDLKLKITLRDDQVKYYKELLDTKQASFKPEINNVTIKQPTSNLKEDILNEMQFLKQHAGKVLSVKLFERLQPKYDFIVILSEITSMNKNNEITWAEAPNPPEALSEIKSI